MTSALEDNFANVVVVEDDDRRRRWRIQSPIPERLQPRQENTIEALEIAARAARDENRLRHARALEDLRDSLITRLSPRDALRSEADAEAVLRSEEHPSELQSLMRISYAVFCLKKKNKKTQT